MVSANFRRTHSASLFILFCIVSLQVGLRVGGHPEMFMMPSLREFTRFNRVNSRNDGIINIVVVIT